MKKFNGKAIYNPSGKAGEYAAWACNFYVGCSNECEYCYCKKGILAPVMGQDMPQLKKCFRDELHALEVFEKEMKINLTELQKHGLFLSFTTDPMLDETKELTMLAINECLYNDIPVKILTKCTKYINQFSYKLRCTEYDLSMIAFGFTLTGHDELEPNASTNAERIEAMKKLHDAGFKTFASIEPIIDINSSLIMIAASRNFCNLFKIGIESGKKYNKDELLQFTQWVDFHTCAIDTKIYWKDSLLKSAGINREDLPANCVGRDYNIFDQQQ